MGVIVRSGPPGAVRAEASALAAVSHPHLARPVAVVTEAVAGPSLASLLAAGPLPWSTVAALLAPVADALAAVHRAGWVHGDVSAANVVVGSSGGVLVDLGCARPAGQARATGTPGTVAPEVEAGGPVTPAADVWALAAVARAAVGGPPLPADAALALRRALADDPDARPSAAQLAAALTGTTAAAVGQPVTRDYGPRPPVPPALHPTHRRPVGPVAAAVALAAAVAAVVVLLTARPAGEPDRPPPTDATWDDGILTVSLRPGEPPVRIAVGAPGDAVALGDWDCDGVDTPAAYRPSTGTLTIWNAWPATDGAPLPPAEVRPADGLPRPDCR